MTLLLVNEFRDLITLTYWL